MSLPDTSLLSGGTVGPWRDLALRFRSAGLTGDYVRSVEAGTERLPEPVRSRWIRLRHRRTEHPASTAVLLFSLGEEVSGERVRSLLGPRTFDHCRETGLVAGSGDGWRSPYRLEIVNGLWVFADHEAREPDSVMAVGESTQLLLQASFPQHDVGTALDLGCGAGVVALLLAGAAGRVVATDTNPRAVALARFNAELNGVSNVEVRSGDLWAPVRGQRFDLIASQPPFHPCPPGAESVRFLHGGERGDEIPRRVLAGMAAHLAPGGCGFLLSDFPWDEHVPLESSLRHDADDPATSLLVLRLEELAEAETECARLASLLEPGDEEAFGRAFDRLLAHLTRLGIRRIQQAVVVVSDVTPPGRSRELVVPAGSWTGLHRSFVDRLLEADEKGAGLPGAGRRT